MKMNLGRWLLLGCVALLGVVGATSTSIGAVTPPKPPSCLAGTALALTKDKCVTCPAGTYTDVDGAECTSESCCQKCPSGHICEKAGTTRPQMCEENTAARFNRTSCIACSNGYFSNPAAQCTLSTDAMDSCCMKR